MTRLRLAALCLGMLLPISAPGTPKVAVHVRLAPQGSARPCDYVPTDVPCSQLSTEGLLGRVRSDYFVYLIAEETDPGMNGASFGIAYDAWYPQGLDIYSSECLVGDVTASYRAGRFGSWPEAWSGIRLMWSSCQQGTVTGYENEGMRTVMCGMFVYAYSEDILYITPHPDDGKATVTDCEGHTIVLPDSALGRGGFGGKPGFNPCTGAGTWTPLPEVQPVQPPYQPPPPPYVPDLSAPAVLLHVTHDPHPDEWCGKAFSSQDVVTAASLQPEDNPHVVYLLAVPEGATELAETGITGVQLGIQYPTRPEEHRGMKVLGWHSCSDLEFPGDTWPASGGSNTITWSLGNCAMGDLVTVGYFTVSAYDPSAMSIIPFPPSGFIKVATCKGAETVVEEHVDPTRAGWVSFGSAAIGADNDGCNPLREPCAEPTAVVPSTWGKLKRLYR